MASLASSAATFPSLTPLQPLWPACSKHTKANPALWPNTCFFLCPEQGFSFTSFRSFLQYHLREVSPAPSPFETALPYVSSLVKLKLHVLLYFSSRHHYCLEIFIFLSSPSPASSTRMEAQWGQGLFLSRSEVLGK